jgi:hypothetical protein
MQKKTRGRVDLGSGFWESFSRLLVSVRERVQHDRQPATAVVVMPISMMAAICKKHCPGLIPDAPVDCQTLSPELVVST